MHDGPMQKSRHYYCLLTNRFNRFNRGYDKLLTVNRGLEF